MRKLLLGIAASLIAGLSLAQDRPPPSEALVFTTCHQLIAVALVYKDKVIVLDQQSGVPAETALSVAQSAASVKGYELGCSTGSSAKTPRTTL